MQRRQVDDARARALMNASILPMLHHWDTCTFSRWTACRRCDDAATMRWCCNRIRSGRNCRRRLVSWSRRERKRRASRRKNFSREKRRATAREHFRRAAVSGMIKNGTARYKKINTFHYRNPGNSTEHLSHRLHYERKKARKRGMSRQASGYFHQCVSQAELKFCVERKRKYIASACDFEQLRTARANTRGHSILSRLLKSERSSGREGWSNPRG